MGLLRRAVCFLRRVAAFWEGSAPVAILTQPAKDLRVVWRENQCYGLGKKEQGKTQEQGKRHVHTCVWRKNQCYGLGEEEQGTRQKARHKSKAKDMHTHNCTKQRHYRAA